MSETVGKIPELAVKIITAISYGISISVALARIIIRLHINKHFGLDDWLLVLACISLTAATGLLLYSLPTVYLIQATAQDPLGLFGNGGNGIQDLDTLLIKINYFAKFDWVYLILSWTTIFSVKFGFLVFFKQLVRGLPEMYRYWKIVVSITAVVYAFSLVDGVVACDHEGLSALSCSVRYAREVGAIAIGLDILTDILILAIPVHLLWKVQIKLRQKLGLAAFLCLSILMILIAIVRISGFVYKNSFDILWVMCWQEFESCVAVFTISITAFRSMFVASASRREASPWQKSPYSSWRRRYKKSATSSRAHELDNVSIPGATLTGVRTVIGGPRTQHDTLLSMPGEEDWPLRPPAVAARTSLGRLRQDGSSSKRTSSLQHTRYESIEERPPERGWSRHGDPRNRV